MCQRIRLRKLFASLLTELCSLSANLCQGFSAQCMGMVPQG